MSWDKVLNLSRLGFLSHRIGVIISTLQGCWEEKHLTQHRASGDCELSKAKEKGQSGHRQAGLPWLQAPHQLLGQGRLRTRDLTFNLCGQMRPSVRSYSNDAP